MGQPYMDMRRLPGKSIPLFPLLKEGTALERTAHWSPWHYYLYSWSCKPSAARYIRIASLCFLDGKCVIERTGREQRDGQLCSL